MHFYRNELFSWITECAPWIKVYLWHITIGKATRWKQGVKRVWPFFRSAAQTKGKNIMKSTKKPTFTVWHHRLTTAARLTSWPMVPTPFSLCLFHRQKAVLYSKAKSWHHLGFFSLLLLNCVYVFHLINIEELIIWKCLMNSQSIWKTLLKTPLSHCTDQGKKGKSFIMILIYSDYAVLDCKVMMPSQNMCFKEELRGLL